MLAGFRRMSLPATADVGGSGGRARTSGGRSWDRETRATPTQVQLVALYRWTGPPWLSRFNETLGAQGLVTVFATPCGSESAQGQAEGLDGEVRWRVTSTIRKRRSCTTSLRSCERVTASTSIHSSQPLRCSGAAHPHQHGDRLVILQHDLAQSGRPSPNRAQQMLLIAYLTGDGSVCRASPRAVDAGGFRFQETDQAFPCLLG